MIDNSIEPGFTFSSLLGHRAYLKGTAAFDKVVETFGTEVIGEDGEINRKVLGPKVFADKVFCLQNKNLFGFDF